MSDEQSHVSGRARIEGEEYVPTGTNVFTLGGTKTIGCVLNARRVLSWEQGECGTQFRCHRVATRARVRSAGVIPRLGYCRTF